MTETQTYTLIDGRKISSEIKKEISDKVGVRKQEGKKFRTSLSFWWAMMGPAKRMSTIKLRPVRK
jgi:hypothetical protein